MPSPKLPDFVSPMLARLGRPFDSEKHFFELKWDGIRALGAVDRSEYRLFTRRRNDMTARYPELAFLGQLEPGVMFDGEVVVLDEGIPSFQRVLQREQARNERRIRSLTHSHPALYVVFDLLYEGFESVMDQPLVQRRERLHEIVAAAGDPRFVFSDGVVGDGLALFARACELQYEGVVAKRLDSKYAPGRRTDAWTKFKKGANVYCVIVGFVPKGDNDFKSLIVATDEAGALTVIGRVASGLGEADRERLNRELRERIRDTPVAPTSLDGVWVEPTLFCAVSYVEKTSDGMMRAPVFHGLVHPDERG